MAIEGREIEAGGAKENLRRLHESPPGVWERTEGELTNGRLAQGRRGAAPGFGRREEDGGREEDDFGVQVERREGDGQG